MIRLNVFFKIKDAGNISTAIELGQQLVEASLRDEGCKSYGMFQSIMDPTIFNIIETWENEELLHRHSQAKHFTEIVPKLEQISDGGLKLERFEF